MDLIKLSQVTSLRDFLYKTYASMSIGLFLAFSTSLLTYLLLPHEILFTISLISSIILTFYYIFNINNIFTKSFHEALNSFIIISVLEGASLGVIYHIFSSELILQALLCTGVTFATVSIYGHSTKSDLSQYIHVIFAGFIAILLCSVLTMILSMVFHFNSAFTSTFAVSISMVSVILVTMFIAYETQMLRTMYYSNQFNRTNLVIFGAINLTIDFINLFRHILRILAYFSRKK